mmetsp:Transcript_52015/g.139921  ORF Transcript_52015/g.139921 Transcript_52015/m.139921 type:complete len:197 (-) Transcript_52015:6-596(-)
MSIYLFRRAALLALLVIFCTSGVVGSQGNLRKKWGGGRVVDETQIVPHLFHNTTRQHLNEIEEFLRFMFMSLPKDDLGYVSRESRAMPLNEFPVDNVYKSHLPRLILQYIEKILHIEHIGLEELASIVAAVEALVRSSVEEKLGLGSAPHPGRAYLRLSAALDVAGVSVAKLFPMGRFAVAVLLGRPMGKENGLLP